MGDKIASKFGLSKLNAACLSKSAEFVAALLEDSSLSASQGRNETDGDGWTAVHFACQNKKGGAAILKLLIGRGFSLQDLTNNGSSPLHEASRNGSSDAAQLILVHLAESPPDLSSALELKDRDGNTPLHLACRGGHKEVVNTLLKYGYDKLVDSDVYRHSVCHANSTGSTPIGLAITGDHLETARLVLDSLPPGNPTTTLKDFCTLFPHGWLIESLHAAECEPMNIFFLGDSGSGKSTFIKTLQAHSQSTLSALYTLLPYVSHPADTHKVGIVPTAIEYPRRNHKCPIIFHDVTGHRNYAHEALFKCAENPLESIYIVTVDIRVGEEAIRAEVLYWLNFLAYSLSHHLANKRSSIKQSEAKIRVVVIGTFNDQMPRFSRPQVVLTALCRTISDKLLSHFDWKGCYALNTRRAYSWKMIQLRSVLQEQCQRVHLSDNCLCERVSPQTYLLAVTVSNLFVEVSTTVMSFEKVIECVKSSNTSISCKLLRNSNGGVNEVALMGLCQSLKHFSQFSIFETTHSSPDLHKYFIINDIHRLLSNINETLEGLPHSNGIVSHSNLQVAFEQFNFPSGFIIEFMESFQICEGVTGDGLRRMRQKIRTSRRSLSSTSSFKSLRLPIKQSSCETPPTPRMKQHHHRRTTSYPGKFDAVTVARLSPMGSLRSVSHSEDGTSPQGSLSHSSLVQHHSSSRRRHPRQKGVPYCFFPTLVPTQPPDKWQKDYEKYTHGFAWSLAPENGDYFPPHFVTALLFRLLHAFAPFATGHTYQHEKVCDLWNCGIVWQDPEGTRACVAVHDNQAITLSMQCVQDQELRCLQLRNQVMTEIMNQKNELHPEIRMLEVLVPDDQKTDFPIYNPADAPACFDKMEIGSAITRRESVLNCTKRKNHVKLSHLLFLEPLSLLSNYSLLQQLLNEDNQDEKMSDEFCLDLAKEVRDKWQLLARYFQLHPSYIADVERGNQADNLSPYWAAHEAILHLRDSVRQGSGVHTYRDLRESLLDISIFNERELNDLAKIELLVETEDSDD